MSDDSESPERGRTLAAPHTLRAAATSFGEHTARYDRTRAPYPGALIVRVADLAPSGPMLDVGSGTGIEGRQFAALGRQVLGVEPDARMVDFSRRHGLDAEQDHFETWDPRGREFAAVVAGTSWHWVDPVKAARKAAQLLVDDGVLAPFWHVQTMPDHLFEAFADAIQAAYPEGAATIRDAGQGLVGYRSILDRTTDGMRASEKFHPAEEERFSWEQSYEKSFWLEQLATSGWVTRLDAATAQRVLGQVEDAIGSDVVTMHTDTVLIVARRR